MYTPKKWLEDAETAARALAETQRRTAKVYRLANELFVVEEGQGDLELDFAYAPHDAIARANGDTSIEPESKPIFAVSYFLRTGRRLGLPRTTGRAVLSGEQLEVLDLVRRGVT